MNNYTAHILDPDTCLERGLQQSQLSNITLCPAASAEQLSASISASKADLILLDLDLPEGANGLELVAELRKQKPGIPVILLTTKTPSEEDWLSAASKPLLELMQTPVTFGKLMYHVSRLFQAKESLEQFTPHEVTVKPVDELRNENGRLDADLVCNIFGVNMTDVSANVGISRQALTKTPASLTAQTALRNFERVARSLMTVTGSIKGLKMWLNSPNDRFEGHTPLEIIKLGKVQLLSDWVDDARLGSPD